MWWLRIFRPPPLRPTLSCIYTHPYPLYIVYPISCIYRPIFLLYVGYPISRTLYIYYHYILFYPSTSPLRPSSPRPAQLRGQPMRVCTAHADPKHASRPFLVRSLTVSGRPVHLHWPTQKSFISRIFRDIVLYTQIQPQYLVPISPTSPLYNLHNPPSCGTLRLLTTTYCTIYEMREIRILSAFSC